MKHILFGVMGHVDHGKTALVRALTGMETDRLPEEQRRGMSIALGFAHARYGEIEADFIDMPGHERFVRTMVSGATGIQAALLVVDAHEGVMPQTREHVDVASLLGVRRAVIAVNKADLVDRATAEAAGTQAAALVSAAGLQAGASVLVSALTGQGLDDLRTALSQVADEVSEAEDAGFAYLPVDRAFSMSGHGTVVTGTLRRGRLAKGDQLALLPGERTVRVRGLQVHGGAVDAALPGQRVAVNVRGAEVEEATRGTALASPGAVAPSTWLTVELSVPTGGADLRNGARLNLLVGAAEVPVRLRLLDGDTLAPGQSGFAQLRAGRPVAVPARDRFVLRTASPAATVAGGQILDPQAQRLRRNHADTLAFVGRLAPATGPELLEVVLTNAGVEGVSLGRLTVLSGLSPARVRQLSTGIEAERAGDWVIARDAAQRLERGISARLQRSREPHSLAQLAKALTASPETVDFIVARLAEQGRVRVEAGAVRWLRADQERARADGDAALAARVAEALRRGGLSPPDLADDSRELRRALERLVRENLAVRTFDRVQKREIVFHREAVEQARRTLQPLLGTGPGLTVSEIGKALGATRKFSVPLLEHLDAVQFTRRVGERRVLGPSARV